LGVEKIMENYNIVRKELEKFGEGLTEKKEVIVLSKTDLVSVEEVETVAKMLSGGGHEVMQVTVLDDKSVKIVGDEMVKILRRG
jgi:GTP-binding protein